MGGRPQRCTLVYVVALAGVLASAALAQDAAPRLAVATTATIVINAAPPQIIFSKGLRVRIASNIIRNSALEPKSATIPWLFNAPPTRIPSIL